MASVLKSRRPCAVFSTRPPRPSNGSNARRASPLWKAAPTCCPNPPRKPSSTMGWPSRARAPPRWAKALPRRTVASAPQPLRCRAPGADSPQLHESRFLANARIRHSRHEPGHPGPPARHPAHLLVTPAHPLVTPAHPLVTPATRSSPRPPARHPGPPARHPGPPARHPGPPARHPGHPPVTPGLTRGPDGVVTGSRIKSGMTERGAWIRERVRDDRGERPGRGRPSLTTNLQRS